MKCTCAMNCRGLAAQQRRSADMAELASDVAMGEPIDLEPREPFDTRVGDVGPNCLLVIFGCALCPRYAQDTMD